MKLIAHQISGVPALCTAPGAPGMVDGLDAFILEGEPSPQAFARRAAELIDCPELLRSVRETARARAYWGRFRTARQARQTLGGA